MNVIKRARLSFSDIHWKIMVKSTMEISGTTALHREGLKTYLDDKSNPMQLMMYLGNDLIEAIPVNTESLSQPGYLGKFKRVLKEKYAALIAEYGKGPEFLVINPAPSMNAQKK
jgi:hypothetical protein